MTRLLLPVGLLVLAAGCNPTVNGSLIDGLTNQPIPGKAADAAETDVAMRIIAKAVTFKDDGTFEDNHEAGLTCMSDSADILQDGTFVLTNMCLSQTAYLLKLTDDQLFLGDFDSFAIGADVKAPQVVKAWRVTNGAGVYSLKGNDLAGIKSRKNFSSDVIKDSTEVVWFPDSLPKDTPLVDAEHYLIIAGAANADLQLAPLVNSGPRVFNLAEGQTDPPKMPMPWAYVGTSFTDDATFERKTVTIDESKVITLDKRGQKVKIIPGSAVSPPGRMVLMAKDAKKGFVLDVGAKGEDPAPAEVAPPE